MSKASNRKLIRWIGITLAVMFILPLVAASSSTYIHQSIDPDIPFYHITGNVPKHASGYLLAIM